MNRRIRVLIVDDEKPARGRLMALLQQHPAVQLTAACAGGQAALDALSAATQRGDPIDIIFLDVQMPEMDGFAVLESLCAMLLDPMPMVVFTTAHDEYAVRAFDAHAVDYLLKPYSDERFEVALTRAIRVTLSENSDALVAQMRALLDRQVDASPHHRTESPHHGYLDRLALKDRGRVHIIQVADIRWIAADGVYVTIHTISRAYLHREVLGRVEVLLDPRQFVRIHRSHIVNFDRIHELVQDAHGDYTVKLDDATALKVSRLYRPRLEARLSLRR